MTYPIKRDKTITPTVETSMSVQSQGTVPYKKMEDVPMNGGFGPTAPKGEQKARGFGLMLRSQMYTVR
jgi:hypothetical protein